MLPTVAYICFGDAVRKPCCFATAVNLLCFARVEDLNLCGTGLKIYDYTCLNRQLQDGVQPADASACKAHQSNQQQAVIS